MRLTRLSESIVVGHLETPLAGAVVVEPSTPSRSALRALDRCNFDQAPVVENGEPIGYVLARDLRRTRGSVRANMRSILPQALASNTAPLEVAMPWLGNSGFLFLLAGKEISGFVVPSDLNKQAGRSYFYLGLTELELRLATEIRRISEDIDPIDCLNPASRTRIRRRLKQRTEANVEADAVAEMNLSELFQVAGRYTDLPRLLGVDDWDGFWSPINQLRLRIAHSVRPVLESQSQIGELLQSDQAVHSVIEALAAAE